ncbi:dihydroorotate dehydrogenase [Candidatus Peregrinibacteria bacterium]|nr:dihydroorotate dehydrogenase [Candidatus Peregrinibacteria bacterium]
MADLKVKFCGKEFSNPTVLASGVLGVTAASWKNVVSSGAGGITTKSVWFNEHKGHPNPTIITTPSYMMNAVGLPDAGVEKAKSEINEYLKAKPAPLIVSIVGGRTDEFVKIAEQIAQLDIDIIEVNISCPNVESEFGKPFACVADDAKTVTAKVKAAVKKLNPNISVIVKLSPNTEDIVKIANSCAQAGADGFCLINTLGPGLAINLETRMPILANKVGGISGPAIKPLAVKLVNDVFRAVKLPIIGTGGVTTGEDALEMMMAGAILVGVGSAVYYRGIDCFSKITNEMNEWCDKNGVKSLTEIIGSVKR